MLAERGVTWSGPGTTLRDDAALVEPIQGIQELTPNGPWLFALQVCPRRPGAATAAATGSRSRSRSHSRSR